MASLPRSARLLRALFVVTCVVPLVQACGRSDLDDYQFDSDGTITTGASSSTAGRGPTGGGTRSANGGANSRGGRSSVGGSGPIPVAGGGPIPQGGAVSFGGTVSAGGSVGIGGVGGFGIAGAAGSVTVTPITCGNQTCDASTQSCCVGLAGLSCIGKNQTCGGAVLGCTLGSDCGGNGICCISITGDVADASSCKPQCDTFGTGRDRQLCQTDDECTPPFRFCTATIFGVNICTRRP